MKPIEIWYTVGTQKREHCWAKAIENPYHLVLQGSGTSLGDVNGDDTIDLLDVQLCLQIAQGYLTPTAAQRQAADVDSNGDVDETDAKILSEYIIGMRSTLP